MQALTKKHHTKKQTTKDKIIHVQVGRRAYAIPKNVAEQYRVDPNENKYKEEFISVEELFKILMSNIQKPERF